MIFFVFSACLSKVGYPKHKIKSKIDLLVSAIVHDHGGSQGNNATLMAEAAAAGWQRLQIQWWRQSWGQQEQSGGGCGGGGG
jgi:hypothetical protein